MRKVDIAVFGDINVDSVATVNLPFRFADLVDNGVITWLPLVDVPGGSGLNFARFAREAGYSALLVGRVGDDLAGRLVSEWLASSGILAAVSVSARSATGRALIARDQRDVRLLVNNDVSANADLSPSDIEGHWDDIAGSGMIYISGYCLMDREVCRYKATRDLLARLADRGPGSRPRIVFDVVPHRIYETMGFEEFAEITRGVDILISEVATMRRFLGLGSRAETVDTACAGETLAALKRRYPRSILRYGPSGCDEELLWDGTTGRSCQRETGHARAGDRRGFGDRLTLDALSGFFRLLPSVS